MQVQNPTPGAGPNNVNPQNLNYNGQLPVDSSITTNPIDINSLVEYHTTAQPAAGVSNVHLYLNGELNTYWTQNPGTNGRCPACNLVVNVWIPASVIGP